MCSALFFSSAFEYVIVKDVGQAGSFDEAVKGVEAIVHTVSTLTAHFPVFWEGRKNEQLDEPAPATLSFAFRRLLFT